MTNQHTLRSSAKLFVGLVFALSPQLLLADSFTQTNLVSNLSTEKAAFIDPNLRDPWGMSFSVGKSPIWVSDRAAGVSTLYNGAGVPFPPGNPLIVTVPPGAPTGQVFAGGTTFRLNGAPVFFIFDTLLSGTIDAWNPGAGTAAVVMATTPGANYTGLALANNTLYAANFTSGGGINAFDSNFAPTTLSGKFVDPTLPSGYAPFNIQAINGTLYVEYGKLTPGVPVALPGGGGYVDEFDTNGNFIRRLAGNAPLSGPLDEPWGVAVVLPGRAFGPFGAGDVLIGNFGNGEINAFTSNGNALGTLNDANHNPLVNPGLWTIAFDPGAPGSTNPNALYFSAGINGGRDGLFGTIQPVPEPAAWSLAALGVLGLSAIRRRHRKHTISA